MNNKMLILLVGGILLVTGYLMIQRRGSTEESAPVQDITGSYQALQVSDAQGALQETGAVRVTATIEPTQISGSAGCNRYTGSITITSGQQVTVEPNVAMTMMACDEVVMNLEQNYLTALQKTARYQLEGDKLTFSDNDGQTLIVYTRQQPVALEGTQWQATGINNGNDAVVGTVTTALTTARFENGVVSGTGGCNTYTAEYQVEGSSLTIRQVASTLMACAEEGVGEQEAHYFQALERVTTYAITDQTLELRDDTGALQVGYKVAQ